MSRHPSVGWTAEAGDGRDAGGRATQEQLPDAGANDGVGLKGTRQEPRVIQFFFNLLKGLDDQLRC